jgi:glycosyltransferase involved in cell wall biosynthesis
VSAPIRIGIDARELLGATTGVGRYLGELLQRWTSRRDAGSRRFLLFTPEPLTLPLPPGTCDVRVVGRGRGTWWEQTHLRRALGREPLDAFFAPAYTAPLLVPAPLAVTIHDVSFAAHPEWFRPREGMRRRWLTRRAARAASVIFTVSAFSAREIAQRLDVDATRIQVVPNGVTSRTITGAADRRRDPLVLYAGSVFNRRRVPDLIAAFALAARNLPHARLAIVGDDRTWPPQDLPGVAAARGVDGRVDFHRYLPDAELDALFQRAAVFAFLSEYEGFGLTPLEALSAGVPAVVLDTEVAREVYGDAAVYVRPGDIDGAAAALTRFLTDPDAGAAVLARAPEVLARYSWDAAAERTLAHLDRIARR